MKYGIVTRSFGGMSVEQAAEKMESYGYRYTELCMTHTDFPGWVYGGFHDMEAVGITKESTKEKADILRAHGITVTSLGVFSDLVTPDDEFSARCMEHFERCIEMAAYAGIPNISTELGLRKGERGLLVSNYEADYARVKQRTIHVASKAKEYGINVAIEACVLDCIPSAKRLRDFIVQIRSEAGLTNIKALLDMANFIANSDEDDAFKYLNGHIAYFHGKDRKVNDAFGKILGDGEINWVKFFENYFVLTPEIPFILEYTNNDTAVLTNERVKLNSDKALANLKLKGYIIPQDWAI
jgi:sugar phosphate isomerase/epimerase